MGALVLLGIDWERDWLVIFKVCLAPSNTMQGQIENTIKTQHTIQFLRKRTRKKDWLLSFSAF